MTKTIPYTKTLSPNQYNFDHTARLYDQSLHAVYHQIKQARSNHHDPEAINLAETLIEKAKLFDIHQTYHMIETPYNGQLSRDLANPPEYSHPSLAGQVWADDPVHLLEAHEQWNAARRKTNTNISYQTDANGLPVNPYVHFGVKGRGMIGRFGPNHAVDNGILRIMPNNEGVPALHALGIIRHDNGLPALCGGFTNFTQNAKGIYQYDKEAIVTSQTHEFFEELVSGSVELLPHYQTGLDQKIETALKNRALAQGKDISDKQKESITNQIITERKLEQITQEDPQFLNAMAATFSNAYPCYAGPVLASSRNTDSAWMETHLSWFILDEKKWDALKENSKFNYDFKAGDDAQAVLWHEINPALMETATPSHDAFFAYLLSSYLLTEKQPDQHVKQQARVLVGYFSDVSGPVKPLVTLAA